VESFRLKSFAKSQKAGASPFAVRDKLPCLPVKRTKYRGVILFLVEIVKEKGVILFLVEIVKEKGEVPL